MGLRIIQQCLGRRALNWTQFKGNKRIQITNQFFRSSSNAVNVDQEIDTKNWIYSKYPEVGEVSGIPLHELLWSNLAQHENLPAFECSVSGRILSHGDIYNISCSFATALIKSGLQRGDIVGIFLPNILEFAPVLMGIMQAGLVPTPINPLHTSDEVTRTLNMVEAKAIVSIPELLQVVRSAKGRVPSLQSVVLIGENEDGCHSFEEMIKTKSDPGLFPRFDDFDTRESLAFLPFSSGTLGTPKGVMLTHSNICTNLRQITSSGLTLAGTTARQEKQLGIVPFFHIYGSVVVMMTNLLLGAHTVLLPKFEPNFFLNVLRKSHFTTLPLSPPLLTFLTNSIDFDPRSFQSAHTVLVAAAPVGRSLINRFLEKIPTKLFLQEGYGMTELSPVSHLLHPSYGNEKAGSCGNSVPSTICKVVDLSNGRSLGPNKKGELCVKSAAVMKGYFNNKEATDQTITSDGWLHTGDIAFYDEDGAFYIVDRLKELIKVKGHQVAPAELEDVLKKHPDIYDAGVIGISDEQAGELPFAYIVKRSVHLNEESVHTWLRDKVAKYKQLKGGIEFVDSIPKAASGKIIRRILKTDWMEKHSDEHHHHH